jgi:hypothetical protein
MNKNKRTPPLSLILLKTQEKDSMRPTAPNASPGLDTGQRPSDFWKAKRGKILKIA